MPAPYKVYLSWNGETFGPYNLRSIHDGFLNNQFPGETTFWMEGYPDWLPLSDFPYSLLENLNSSDPDDNNDDATTSPEDSDAPSDSSAHRPHNKSSHSSHSKPRKSKRHRKSNARGVLITLFVIALAIGAIVGILLLLMKF